MVTVFVNDSVLPVALFMCTAVAVAAAALPYLLEEELFILQVEAGHVVIQEQLVHFAVLPL